MDTDSAKKKAKGQVNQAVGGARQKVGAATGNDVMEGKGRRQQAKGDVQEVAGKMEGAGKGAMRAAKEGAAKASDRMKGASRS